VFDLAARRKLNRGHSDGFSRSVEIVATPLLFGLLGRVLDGWFDTRPALMLALGAFGVVGVFVKLWFEYDHQMREEQAAVPARRGIVRTPAPVDESPPLVVPAGGLDGERPPPGGAA